MSQNIENKFTDKKGREIYFEVSGNVIAYAQGIEVGSVEFDFDDFVYRPCLSSMNVVSAYSRAGIGTEMIRLAAEVHGRKFDRPSFLAQGGSNEPSSGYFTQDGLALMRHCINIGIIDDIPESDESADDWQDD